MAKPFVRGGVPDGSRLEIVVKPIVGKGKKPEGAPFVATGFLQTLSGPNKSWTDMQLRAGVSQTLSGDPNAFVTYDGWVELVFAGKAKAELSIEVFKPDRSKHFQRSVIERSSGVDHTTIVITMAKKGN